MLHPSELGRYDEMQYEMRKKSYLLGRVAAKQALGALLKEKDLSRFNIRNGIFNHPVVSCIGTENVQVSISHSNNIGAALAFSESHPMAIDLEKICADVSEVIQTQLTVREKEQVIPSTCPQELSSTILWTVKEALSKTLKAGLTIPMHVLEVECVEKKGAAYISYFRQFGQYKAISIPSESYVCTLICPRKTELVFDINALGMCML